MAVHMTLLISHKQELRNQKVTAFNMEALTRDVALGIKDPKSRKEMLNGPYANQI